MNYLKLKTSIDYDYSLHESSKFTLEALCLSIKKVKDIVNYEYMRNYEISKSIKRVKVKCLIYFDSIFF